jgi:3-oxoacyl-[acyl-carrier-protein] synthase II
MPSGVNIQGAGWIGPSGYGRVRKGIRAECGDLDALWKSDPVFERRAKNFGRFDAASRLAYYAAALALDDAGSGERRDFGLIGTGAAGCLASNQDYFKDYVKCGRTLARGNLFVYTLTTSPLAEAAIHFGLEGPLLYALSPERPLAAALETAAGMIRRGEAAGMLVLAVGAAEALCTVLSTQAGVLVESVVEGSQADVVAAWERAFRTGDL